MDISASTKVVYDRIQKLEPENVSKIIGFLLLQDHGEREMIRLAWSHDNLINALINHAKTCLRLDKLPVSAPMSASLVNQPPALEIPVPFTNYSTSPSHQVTSPVMHGAPTSFWDTQITGDQQMLNLDFSQLGYMDSVAEDYRLENQLQFLNLDDKLEFVSGASSASSELPSSYFYTEPAGPSRTSRRSPSLPVFPVKVCHYFNKGYCKHGNNCRYYHGNPMSDIHFSPNSNEVANEEHVVSPLSLEKLELELTELLKSRRGMPVSIASLPMMYFEKYGRTLQAEGYLTESQRHGKAGYSLTKLLARLKNTIRLIDRPHGQHAVVLAEDVPKYSDPGGIVSGSRQIYLTFPAECTFTEQDVSNYFSKFGLVQDVRIPCLQKRMFGFVTFSSAETVKELLAKGNPHFVCGARVLVKPYKDKPKLIDRNKIQHPTYYSLHFMDRDSESQSMPSNSRIFGKRIIEEHEHALEFERRLIPEMQLTPEPLNHKAYFGYSDGLKLAEEQPEFEYSDRFSYLLDILNNGSNDDKLRNINTNYSDQDSTQSLNLPESPFASAMGCGISTAS